MRPAASCRGPRRMGAELLRVALVRVAGSALLASLAAAPLAAATRLPAAASTPFDPVYEALGRVLEFRAVAIAPDGSSLAWVEARELPGGPPSDDSAIFVQALVPG